MSFFPKRKPGRSGVEVSPLASGALASSGRTLAQGALAWVLTHSPRAIPIPGFRNLKQAQENMETLQKGLLTAAQMQEIEILLARS